MEEIQTYKLNKVVHRATQSSISLSMFVHTCNNNLMCVSLRMCIYVPVCVFVLCSMWPRHRMLQCHVLRSSERQSVCAVMVDQLRDTGEDAAALIQREAQTLHALRLSHNDVHTTLTGLKSDGVFAGS